MIPSALRTSYKFIQRCRKPFSEHFLVRKHTHPSGPTPQHNLHLSHFAIKWLCGAGQLYLSTGHLPTITKKTSQHGAPGLRINIGGK
jgi:hypothetical protein